MEGFEEIENIIARLPRRNKVENLLEDIKEDLKNCDLASLLWHIVLLTRILSQTDIPLHQVNLFEKTLKKLSEISGTQYERVCKVFEEDTNNVSKDIQLNSH